MPAQLTAWAPPAAVANIFVSSGEFLSLTYGWSKNIFDASLWLTAKTVSAPVAGTEVVAPTIPSFITIADPATVCPSNGTAAGVQLVSNVKIPFFTEYRTAFEVRSIR